MSADLLSEVRGVAADVFAVDAKTLHAASSPEQVEAWDSVQHLNLVLALEGKYGIQFEPEEMERMKNLGAIAALVGTKLT
ncbi:MAG TPA: acyl carrier protein [Bryobacteraceae bacterium]|jgi:acyl carrier protein|nr:acyl carrier protein [Bryobacteraceae bacterium]